MLAIFCLRLALGLAGALLLLPLSQINSRFFRAHFLTIMALVVAATAMLWADTDAAVRVLGVLTLVSSLAGALSWSLPRAPAGRAAAPLTVAVLAALLLILRLKNPSEPFLGRVCDDFSSAAVLGLSTTAMLVGHSYLIAPAMSIRPLMTMLLALFSALAIRIAVSLAGFAFWTSGHSFGKLDEVTLLLALRWGIGFVGPAVLGFMAWQTAKIRSTQSATGILYVVVIFCFLGELLSQLVAQITGFAL
jgi:hypothetical protein